MNVSVYAVAAYLTVLRFVPETILVSVAMLQVLALVRNGLYGSYPLSALYSVAAVTATIAAAALLYRAVVRP